MYKFIYVVSLPDTHHTNSVYLTDSSLPLYFVTNKLSGIHLEYLCEVEARDPEHHRLIIVHPILQELESL